MLVTLSRGNHSLLRDYLRCDYVYGKMYYVVAFMQCELGLLDCNVRNIRVCCVNFLNTFFFAK